MPVIPALRMLRQEDWEFEAYLDRIARSKKKKKKAPTCLGFNSFIYKHKNNIIKG
jgi:hypothetical protein